MSQCDCEFPPRLVHGTPQLPRVWTANLRHSGEKPAPYHDTGQESRSRADKMDSRVRGNDGQDAAPAYTFNCVPWAKPALYMTWESSKFP